MLGVNRRVFLVLERIQSTYKPPNFPTPRAMRVSLLIKECEVKERVVREWVEVIGVGVFGKVGVVMLLRSVK